MERKEIERLERERAKLEAAREKLEEERQRLEDERQAMEDARQDLEDQREAIEEEAREAKEEERERAQEEMQDMKEDAREQMRERIEAQRELLREKAEAMFEAQQEKLERMAAQMEKAMEGVQEQIENGIAGIDCESRGRHAGAETPKAADDAARAEGSTGPPMGNDMKNVGILNLKDITPEELDKMGEIRNYGVVIVPEELMGKLSTRVTKNMGTIVPYRKGWRIFSGQTDLDRSMLEALEGPIEFIHIGYMTIARDITADLIKAKILAFHNYGQISATDETYGMLMAKCLENYGQIYRNGACPDDEDEVHEHSRHRKRPSDE